MSKSIRHKNKSSKLLLVSIFFAFGICILTFICFVWVNTSTEFERITGLEASKSDGSILVKWDEMTCESYDIIIRAGDDISFMETINRNEYAIEEPLPETTYIISVYANLDYDISTEPETVSIKSPK